MSTITLEVSDETAARVLATPDGLARVRAMIEAAFATKPDASTERGAAADRAARSTPPVPDPLAALWGAIPDSAPVLAPEAATREAMYSDHD